LRGGSRSDGATANAMDNFALMNAGTRQYACRVSSRRTMSTRWRLPPV